MELIRYNVQVFFLINQTDASCCNYHPSFSISRPLTPFWRHWLSESWVQSLLAEPSRRCKGFPALAVRALIHPGIPPFLSHPSPWPSSCIHLENASPQLLGVGMPLPQEGWCSCAAGMGRCKAGAETKLCSSVCLSASSWW